MANTNAALTPPETPSLTLTRSTSNETKDPSDGRTTPSQSLSRSTSRESRDTLDPSTATSQTSSSLLSRCKAPPSEQRGASTATAIVRLAAIIDEMVNTNDFDFTTLDVQELQSHIAPDFVCQIDCIQRPDERMSWEEVVAAWRQGGEDDPGVKLAWTSVSSTVDEPKGFAQVFLEKEITAVGGLKFHVMEEQRWRRDLGKWFITNIMGMRGSPANSGFDSGDMKTTAPGHVEQVRSRPFTEGAAEKSSSSESNKRKR